MLDRIKSLGFHYATIAGITISVDAPFWQDNILAEADAVESEQYHNGLVTQDERYRGDQDLE